MRICVGAADQFALQNVVLRRLVHPKSSKGDGSVLFEPDTPGYYSKTCFPDNLNKLRKGSKRRIGNYQHIYNTVGWLAPQVACAPPSAPCFVSCQLWYP